MNVTHSVRAFLLVSILSLLGTSGSALAAIRPAPANWASDDIVTVLYDPSDGSFALDNPAGDDAAADAITTFEMTTTVDFFTGPAPAGFDGLFDVWSARKAFTLKPAGFFDMDWPAGSVATGVSNFGQIATINGSFLRGGPLEPVDLCCIPEPSGLAFATCLALLVPLLRRQHRFWS